jgi:hypothetical protein
MPEKPEPWYDDAAAALEFCKAFVPLMQDRDRLPALRNKGLKLFKDITGLWLLPANKEGERKDGIPKDFDFRLRRVGLDPRTGRLTDPAKWELALIGLRQKKEEQQRLEELKERKEAIAGVVNGYQPDRPQIPTASQILASAKLEQEITKTVLSRNSAPTSAWQEKIAASPDDYVPGQYGMPIPDDDGPPPPKRAPSAQEIKRRYREQQGGLTF